MSVCLLVCVCMHNMAVEIGSPKKLTTPIIVYTMFVAKFRLPSQRPYLLLNAL